MLEQSCPVCGVKIQKMVGQDRVLFSYGPPATREQLWQKICQHVQKPNCINQDQGKNN
ncbi:hypothetical protein [Roseofilum capinflatum]|uniref:Uncharacterized protein n=1 Tax=Roseofilum capinflatum BLCC-M114 TaxID=3022440 RepID=A0ABT7B0U9_9CYAN|nr:hypothetical protein [Roseofilum capinflatum]MDJ1172764.1 hypothetical protein [Roseofilum capinflatum BLCC-M114]